MLYLFRITENEPYKMHNLRPYVYSRPWFDALNHYATSTDVLLNIIRYAFVPAFCPFSSIFCSNSFIFSGESHKKVKLRV